MTPGCIDDASPAAPPPEFDRLSQLLSASPAAIYGYRVTGDFAPTYVDAGQGPRGGVDQRTPGAPYTAPGAPLQRRSDGCWIQINVRRTAGCGVSRFTPTSPRSSAPRRRCARPSASSRCVN